MDHDEEKPWKDWTPKQWNKLNKKKRAEKRKKLRLARETAEARKEILKNVGEILAARNMPTRSGRGFRSTAGARETDVWHPEDHEAPVAERVGDERRNKTFCRRCKAEVAVKQEGQIWITYDPDGRPHHDTCKNPAPPPEDW